MRWIVLLLLLAGCGSAPERATHIQRNNYCGAFIQCGYTMTCETGYLVCGCVDGIYRAERPNDGCHKQCGCDNGNHQVCECV